MEQLNSEEEEIERDGLIASFFFPLDIFLADLQEKFKC